MIKAHFEEACSHVPVRPGFSSMWIEHLSSSSLKATNVSNNRELHRSAYTVAANRRRSIDLLTAIDMKTPAC